MKVQEVINNYKSYGISIDEEIVKKAIEFVIKYHGSHKRYSGDPHYCHPIQVADTIAQMRLDSDSIVTAILYDTIDDTELTFNDIEKNFSTNIAELVYRVTKLNKIEFRSHSTKQAEYFRKFLFVMSEDIRVLLIKLVDRLHNMRMIDYISTPETRKRIALETMEIYAPLAERIGIQQIKVELQDICFRILNPKIRESIIIESDKLNHFNQIIYDIKKTVRDRGVLAKVYGRRKTPYSTWMKMKQKAISLNQLYDIIAFRVVVNDIQDCYKVLGIIHDTYKIVPDNFQDFIRTPKSNGYQSLHTIVKGPLMQKIEVQIRTQEMHDSAELGVAAHWRYKQGYNASSDDDGIKYSWIRELLSVLEQNRASSEFLQNTKIAMYYDKVFCFTPQGNLITLPKGANIIDFVYMVHYDIQNLCIGAKVNGRVVPLQTKLANSDQVEVIISKN